MANFGTPEGAYGDRTDVRRRAVTGSLRGIRVNYGDVAGALTPNQMPIDAMSGEFRGLQQLGAASQQIGEQLNRLAEYERRTTAIAQIGEAEQKMKQAAEEFELYRVENANDPTTWSQELDSRLSVLQNEVLHDKLSPDAAAELKTRFQGFANSAKTQTKIASIKALRVKATEGNAAELYRATDANDMERIETVLQEGYQAGLYGEDDFERKRITARRQVEADQREQDNQNFESVLEQNPAMAAEMAEQGVFQSMDAGDRMRAVKKAKAEINYRKTEGSEAIINGIVLGEVSDSDIDLQAESIGLTPKETADLKEWREKYNQKVARSAPIDLEKMAALDKDIAEYKPDEDETGIKFAELYRRVELESVGEGDLGDKFRGVYVQRLYNKHPHHNRKQPQEPLDMLRGQFTALIDTYADDGAFGQLTRMEDGKEVSNTEVLRNKINTESTLWRELKEEVTADPERFREPFAVDQWISTRLSSTKAASAADAWQGRNTLFPSEVPYSPEETRKLMNWEPR